MLPDFIINNIFKLLGYNIIEAKKDINVVRELSLHGFIEWQGKKKWEIAKYHYHNNIFYKRNVGRTFPIIWEELPAIEKNDLQQYSDVVAKPFQNIPKYQASTSGSTGTPLNFVKNKYCHARTWATIFDLYNIYGIEPSSSEARFYGIPKDFMSRIVEKSKDLLFNRKRFVIFDMSSNVLEEFIKQFSNNDFVYIYGYTHSIVIFSEYLISKNIVLNSICPSLEKVIVTSELCTDEEKKKIEQGTGLKVIIEYGASEFGIIAFECENGNQHIIGENLFIENNEKGEILVTDLFNKAMPFIRYNIGDLGEVIQSSCTCIFKNNQIIKNLIGRTNDVIILPSGRISPGLTFFYISRAILEKTGGVIKEMLVRQVSVDEIELDVVSNREFSKQDLKEITYQIKLYLEEDIAIKINNLNFIPKLPSGKIMTFRSELNMDYSGLN